MSTTYIDGDTIIYKSRGSSSQITLQPQTGKTLSIRGLPSGTSTADLYTAVVGTKDSFVSSTINYTNIDNYLHIAGSAVLQYTDSTDFSIDLTLPASLTYDHTVGVPGSINAWLSNHHIYGTYLTAQTSTKVRLNFHCNNAFIAETLRINFTMILKLV